MEASETLRRVRADHGLTLRELAAHAGTSHATLAAYEAGRTVPTVATWWRVLRAAGADVAPMFTWRVSPSERRGEELAAVLHLAEQFPARHEPSLVAPVFGRVDPS